MSLARAWLRLDLEMYYEQKPWAFVKAARFTDCLARNIVLLRNIQASCAMAEYWIWLVGRGVICAPFKANGAMVPVGLGWLRNFVEMAKAGTAAAKSGLQIFSHWICRTSV